MVVVVGAGGSRPQVLQVGAVTLHWSLSWRREGGVGVQKWSFFPLHRSCMTTVPDPLVALLARVLFSDFLTLGVSVHLRFWAPGAARAGGEGNRECGVPCTASMVFRTI